MKLLAPDRSAVWYLVAYDPLAGVAWGARLTARSFGTGTVHASDLAGWVTIAISPVSLAQLAVEWLAGCWSLPAEPVDN